MLVMSRSCTVTILWLLMHSDAGDPAPLVLVLLCKRMKISPARVFDVLLAAMLVLAAVAALWLIMTAM
jgi:hypothetical protein